MDAEEYFQLTKEDIEKNLEENPSMDLDEISVSNYILKIIDELKPNRYAEKTTKKIINKYFGDNINSIGIIPHYEGRLIECWLLKVLKVDDTFQNASNYLTQRDNREAGIVIVPLKDKSVSELNLLINKTKIENPSTTLLSICNEDELKEICKILIKDNIISKINKADFLHHFTGQSMDENINKIEFIRIGKKNNPNKSILYTLISELINERSLLSFSKTINYSFRDNKNSIIKLNKNDNRHTIFNYEFKKLCDHAKKRLNH